MNGIWEAVNTNINAEGGKLTDEVIAEALGTLMRQWREHEYEPPFYLVHPDYLRARGDL